MYTTQICDIMICYYLQEIKMICQMLTVNVYCRKAYEATSTMKL